MAGSTQSDAGPTALNEHLAAAASDPRRYLSENDIDDVEEVFDDTDQNGDGVVTRDELEQTLKQFSLPDDEAAAISEALSSHAGGVSLDEVLIMRAQAKLRARVEVIRRSFEAADTDGSGSIDIDELVKFMAGTGTGDLQAERERLLSALDLDGNQEISFDEFLRFDLGMNFPAESS